MSSGQDYERYIPVGYRDTTVFDSFYTQDFVGWREGSWHQFGWAPSSDIYTYEWPIFRAAQEAICKFYKIRNPIDYTVLQYLSPQELLDLGGDPIAPVGLLGTVARGMYWGAGGVDAPQQFTAELLDSGWAVGHLRDGVWVEEVGYLTDRALWERLSPGSRREMGLVRHSVFICHSSKDKPFVRKLGDALKAEGVPVWIDEAEIRVGDSIISRIEQAIGDVDYVAVALSPDAVSSPWVQEELRSAMSEQIEERKIKVLPLLVRDCDIPGFLRDKRYADFREPKRFDEGVEDLLGRLIRRVGESDGSI
jgi:hypothetical protein